MIYSFPVIFILKWFKIGNFFCIPLNFFLTWQLLPLIENFYRLCFSYLLLLFRFYPVKRLYIWSTTSKIFSVTFLSSHWCFQIFLVSWKNLLEKFINNLVCIIIMHKFYIVPLWVHSMLFSNIFWKNKVDCNC